MCNEQTPPALRQGRLNLATYLVYPILVLQRTKYQVIAPINPISLDLKLDYGILLADNFNESGNLMLK